MSYLIDTNVFSELTKRRPSQAVSAWAASTLRAGHYISVITVGEIRRGVERLRRRGDFVQADYLANRTEWVEDSYSDNILPVTHEVARKWGILLPQRIVGDADGLIAATALVHGFIVATRNTKDFREFGVPIINPFEYSA